MYPDELIRRLRSMDGAHALAEVIKHPDRQAPDGVNLERWTCEETPCVVRFVHHNRQGEPDSAVLCIDAAEECSWVYESTLQLVPYPTSVLKLAAEPARAPGRN